MKKFFSTKNVFFKFQNIEYRANVPLGLKVNEFLDTFGKDRPNIMNSKNLEIFKNQFYIPFNHTLTDIETKSMETNPLTVIEDKFSVVNMRYRKINHLREPFNAHSNKLQDFLNIFLDKIKLEKLNTEDFIRYYKSVDKIKSSNLKFSTIITLLLKNIVNGEFLSDYSIEMSEFDKTDEFNLLIIKTNNNLYIPITLVLDGLNFDECIMKNFTILKKISLKYDINHNLGIITDLQKWKFSYYNREPSENNRLVESEKDFLLSLKYDLAIESNKINENTYNILMKIIKGITQVSHQELGNSI